MHVFEYCHPTKPYCGHWTSNNGVKIYMNAKEIVDQHWHLLTDEWKEHFRYLPDEVPLRRDLLGKVCSADYVRRRKIPFKRKK